ncbi:transmembrane protein [Citrus sinensis]|nr:transmembrane protein [Citrus sinensis]
MATGSSREERRKRILDRGSDRLALISGRIQSLPSSPISSPHHHRAATTHLSTQSLVFTRDHHDHLQSLLSNQSNVCKVAFGFFGPAAGTEGPITPSGPHQLLKHSSLVVPREKTYDIGRQVEPQVPKHERKVDPQVPKYDAKSVNEVAAADESTKSRPEPEPMPAAPIVEKPSNDTELLPKPNLFSCKQINSCIIASQGIRSLCALMIALLVVLSYIDDALLGINIVSSESVEALRPLYILLLTDVTIVLAQVFLKQQKQSEEAEKENVEPQEDGNNMTQAIQLMERSLVVYQTARAVFIDFSIYTVVVVCGLSLA